MYSIIIIQSKMIVKLISCDDIVVNINKDEISRIPYVMDFIGEDDIEKDKEVELPVCSINGRELIHIKELLELQTKHGLKFKYVPDKIQKYGIVLKKYSIHQIDPWGGTPYLEYFEKLTAEECVELFEAADYLHCEDLLCGVAYIIGQRQLAFDPEIKKAIKKTFSEYMIKLYLSIITE